MADLTPMMKQYFSMKKKYPDSILFFRLGDFYEMFHEDARIVTRELNLTLTTRDRKKPVEEQTPMCGMPYHSSEGYIAKLIAKGYKIAICEQTEDPSQAKGIVERDVIRVVTPGTLTESSMLDESKNNYLAVVFTPTVEKITENPDLSPNLALALCDISTGSLFVKDFPIEDGFISQFSNEISRFSPREVILSTGAMEHKWLLNYLREGLKVPHEEGTGFLEHQGRKICQNQFKEEDIPSSPSVLCCLGGLFHYLVNTLKTELTFLSRLQSLENGNFLELDLTARRNLELTETLWNREKKGSLLGVLDKTKTSMGGRLLQEWLIRPLTNLSEINLRQGAVGELLENPVIHSQLMDLFREIPDLERIMGRISYGTCSGKELRNLAYGLQQVSSIKAIMAPFQSGKLEELQDTMDPHEGLYNRLLSAFLDELPSSVREGGMIASGFSEDVDRLHHILEHGGEMIVALEEKTKTDTGIKNLKVRFNKVFGYFIEVAKAQADAVPSHWVRKQTTVNSERFISQELKELEETILNAKDQVVALEYAIFQRLRQETCEFTGSVQETAAALAELDVLCSFAKVAAAQNYVAPRVDASRQLHIEEGRHPVVEILSKDSLFVPNDTHFSGDSPQSMIITGPNMAGKSTYMRQVALLVIMAQIGSYVPAKSAHIGLVDRIFTRIGASDDLAGGRSTFMVEMSEVAELLAQSTEKSLLILDEIGRGTSTYDGMSIARAVLEYCHKTIGGKTLFATHYHELSVVEQELEGVLNFSIAAKQKGDTILFLRKIVSGCADQSYGIQVAKLAGVPDSVISRAHDILGELECGTGTKPVITTQAAPILLSSEEQKEQEIIDQLKEVDLDDLSPRAALEQLTKWKESLK